MWTSYKFVQNGKYNVVKFVYEKDAKEYTVDYTNKGLKVGKDFISKTEYEQFVEEHLPQWLLSRELSDEQKLQIRKAYQEIIKA